MYGVSVCTVSVYTISYWNAVIGVYDLYTRVAALGLDHVNLDSGEVCFSLICCVVGWFEISDRREVACRQVGGGERLCSCYYLMI